MSNVIKIVISGESGYCSYDEAYKDKVTLEPASMSYEYIPFNATEINPIRKWRYTTTSPIFRSLYSQVANEVQNVLHNTTELFCTDIGSISFSITFSDKSKEKKTFCCPGDEFNNLFALIKKMIPECEYVPAVLLTKEDYNEDE